MPREKKRQKLAGTPFFVLGCVRSGTTMLRDVLRRHPNLACPEETHFFRWGEPYGTPGLTRTLTGNAVLKRHRQIDGITEDEFAAMVKAARSRAELYEAYMALYIERKKPGATRWFDKTPQNVYGAMLALATVPKARFVHIVRHPVNVVASLRIGKVMAVSDLIGAVNYWREAVAIVAGLRRAYPGRVHELRYEDFMVNPQGETERLLTYLGEPYDPTWFADVKIRESDHTKDQVLSPEEVALVHELCDAGLRHYHYPAPAEAATPVP